MNQKSIQQLAFQTITIIQQSYIIISLIISLTDLISEA